MRMIRTLLLAFTMLSLVAISATASPSLVWHKNTSDSTSLAQVLGSDAGLIGDVEWATALPAAWSTGPGGTTYYIPTRVLGYLRDEANSSQHTDASDAHAWIQDLMGGYSTTAVASIPSNAVVAFVVGAETSKWCGNAADVDKSCPSGCTPSDNPTTCSGCGCAGTKTFETVP